jgi:hypothetical protein
VRLHETRSFHSETLTRVAARPAISREARHLNDAQNDVENARIRFDVEMNIVGKIEHRPLLQLRDRLL